MAKIDFIRLLACLISAGTLQADVLDDWNDAVLHAIRGENTSPCLAARNLAILHLAIYDAVNSIERTHKPYLDFVEHRAPASTQAAATAAAFRVATTLFPSQAATFNSLSVSTLSASDEKSLSGRAVGLAAAEALLEARASDGSQIALTYFPSNQPGSWRRTPPYQRPPELSHWGCVKPFAMERRDQFRPPPPPCLAGSQYAEEFNRVKMLGSRNSNVRTAYETETAFFWSDFTATVTPPGHWNQIARAIANNQKLNLPEKSRLLALLNTALADAAIVCWDAKYRYNFWRPVTAIGRAADDNNPDTTADPKWQPLLVTPAFPEYISGHSTFSGAAGEVLVRFFGRDHLPFTIGSDSLPGVTRTYESISAVVEEIGMSRIFGGIHFPSADERGQAAGRALGKYIFEIFCPPRGT